MYKKYRRVTNKNSALLLHGLCKELKRNNPIEGQILPIYSHANLGWTGYACIKEEFCLTQYCKLLDRVFCTLRMNKYKENSHLKAFQFNAKRKNLLAYREIIDYIIITPSYSSAFSFRESISLHLSKKRDFF